MGLKQRILDFLATLDDEPADGIGEADVDDLDAGTDNTPENAREENVDEDVSEAGTGVTDAAEAEADDAGQTMPDSEVAVAELRDALNESQALNETYRHQLLDAGIDVDAIEAEDVVDDVVDDEADVEQDDEAAQADLDEQKRQIAELSHK